MLECGPGRCEERTPTDGLVVVTNYHGEKEKAPAEDRRYADLCASFAAPGRGKVDGASMERAVRAASSGFPAALMNLQCGVFHPATLEARISLGRPPASSRPFVAVDGAALLGVKAPADRVPSPAGAPR